MSGFWYLICDWNQSHNLFYSIPKIKWQCIMATKIFRNLFLKCHMVNTKWWWNMMFEIPRSKLLNMDWKFCKHGKHQFKYNILPFRVIVSILHPAFTFGQRRTTTYSTNWTINGNHIPNSSKQRKILIVSTYYDFMP